MGDLDRPEEGHRPNAKNQVIDGLIISTGQQSALPLHFKKIGTSTLNTHLDRWAQIMV
jgi:hypothetical protein